MRKVYSLAVVIGAGVLALDQVTKVMVERAFLLGESLPLCSFFSLTYVRNQGAAWGMFQGAHYALAAFALVTLVLLACFWRQVIGSASWTFPVGGLLFGGILGNLIDRVRLGGHPFCSVAGTVVADSLLALHQGALMRKVYSLAVVIGAGVLALDQVTKVMVERAFLLGESLPLCSFFSLTYVRNQGAAWGMFQGAHYALAAFALVTLVLLACFWRQVIGSASWTFPVGGLLFGGILGNLIDRVRLGYVVDFFHFYWGNYHFPCFNVADSAICLAAMILLVAQFFTKDPA